MRAKRKEKNKKKMFNEGVTGFSLKVKRLGMTEEGKKRETQNKNCLFFFVCLSKREKRGWDLERSVRWRIFFPLKCKQLYMMAMAPEERGRISATMAASDFHVFYNYTTRLCCHVSNYHQKYTFDRIC
jgi:hypothetical protein